MNAVDQGPTVFSGARHRFLMAPTDSMPVDNLFSYSSHSQLLTFPTHASRACDRDLKTNQITGLVTVS